MTITKKLFEAAARNTEFSIPKDCLLTKGTCYHNKKYEQAAEDRIMEKRKEKEQCMHGAHYEMNVPDRMLEMTLSPEMQAPQFG